MQNDFVKIMKCRFCGGNTNALALHKRLKNIEGDVFDTEPCDACKKRFETFKYFIGDCGHSGFIRIEALQKVLKPDAFTEVQNSKIFRVEKCFACLDFIKLEDCPTI